MNVILFGATGMIGQGVLRECLRDDAVERVLVIGRSPVQQEHPKLVEVLRSDPSDLSGLEAELAGYDACFFCLGVSAVGMPEAEYRRITHDLTLAVARTLAAANPGLTFVYLSGEGADSTEQGRVMWARVRGRTENELLRLPFRAFAFRPGVVLPQHGVVSKTRLYRVGYSVLGPLIPLLRKVAPNLVTTSEQMGRAMIAVATPGVVPPGADATRRILRTKDINRLTEHTERTNS
ncbi:NAD(P)H-binding protein [Kitasatospora sp. NBC_01250]|uniref:NAD(P)H-binding protein n=1 Tax=unclassified Kitasatospora TaxID=2633591 RepID=UPI002E0E6EC6|nr:MULTISPECIES: NAD(P)H-binding protein [unclassified Kitasatospora]WSJ65480.1 NAD(P)H-binding protein [Kitasatospora sp. NBC_01302]